MNKLYFYTYNYYTNQLDYTEVRVEETAKCYKCAEYDQYGKRKSFPYQLGSYISKSSINTNNDNLSIVFDSRNDEKAKEFLAQQLEYRRNKVWKELIKLDTQIDYVRNWNGDTK